MAVIRIDDNPSDRMLRQFAGIWFPLFWAAIGTFVYLGTRSIPLAAGLAAVGIVVGAIGFVRVAFIRPVFLLWMYAAFPIGWVVSHVVLAAIFYLLLTPIGLLMKLVGYDPLQRRIDRTAPSYWVPVQQPADKTAYFRQF